MTIDILVRADASAVIGSGHIARTAALAGRLRDEGYRVGFACRSFDGDRIAELRSLGYPVFELSEGRTDRLNWLGVPLRDEIESMRGVMEKFEAEPTWIIVDHYALDERWERSMSSSGARIFVVDDLADRSHHCVGLLDQNFHPVGELRYYGKVKSQAQLFLGPSYALLRKEFFAARRNMRARDGEIDRILVLFGGFDGGGYVRAAVQALMTAQVDADVDVIAPASDRAFEEWVMRAPGRPRFHVQKSSDDIAAMMMDADLSIGAGGVTCWERCFLGLPSIVFAIAPNQEPALKALEQDEIVFSLGVWCHRSEQLLASAMTEILADPQRVQAYGQRSFAICGNPDAAASELLAFFKEPMGCLT